MSNSKKDNLEDAAESAPNLNEEAKPSKFNKTKSISEVFSKLELSEDLEEDSVDDISADNEEEIIPIHAEVGDDEVIPVIDEDDEVIPIHAEVGDDEVIPVIDEDDEIIPIHNEYNEDDAYSSEIREGGLVLNPVDDEDDPQEESDLKIENTDDSINLESDENDDNEAISDEIVPELSKNDDIEGGDSDSIVDDVKLENAKPSSQGVIINSNEEEGKDSRSLDSSLILTGIGFAVGLIILIYGLMYYTTASDRVVDNVLSGETAGMAVMIIIIGLIIVVFSALSFVSSRRSLKFMDAFNDIKSIDYNEIKNDAFSRDDIESAFTGVFKKDSTENEDDITPANDESEGSVDASVGSLIGSLGKGRFSKSKSSSQSDENPENSSSNKFKSADDFDSYIEPVHMESNAQDSIFNNSDTLDGSIDDSLDADFSNPMDDDFGESADDLNSLNGSADDLDSLNGSIDDLESEPIDDIGINSRVVDEDAGFEVFAPDSDSDAVDVDAIKEDSIHKFKKSLDLDEFLDDSGKD